MDDSGLAVMRLRERDLIGADFGLISLSFDARTRRPQRKLKLWNSPQKWRPMLIMRAAGRGYASHFGYSPASKSIEHKTFPVGEAIDWPGPESWWGMPY